MKSKYVIALGLLVLIVPSWGQTMRWVPAEQAQDHGSCPYVPEKKSDVQCWMLEYTPAVSGVLTSYTTGFLVSCTSAGSPVTGNQSCSMTSNNRVIDGCGTVGLSLLNSSGNTGSQTNNQIVAGQPVMLHQVCFSIPPGESISIDEDPVTDLTTSIDLGSLQYTTEFPEYTDTQLRSKYAAFDGPGVWLDFQVHPIGPFAAQVDWTIPEDISTGITIVERAFEGGVFEPLGEGSTDLEASHILLFRYVDTRAQTGENRYRLKHTRQNGSEVYSPVRSVIFDRQLASVVVWPNPADETIFIRLKDLSAPGTCSLIDVQGLEMTRLDFNSNVTGLELPVQHLPEGAYTLIVNSGDTVQRNMVVIVH